MGKSHQVAGFQDLLNRTMLEQTLTLFHPRFLTKWEFRDTSIATYYPNFAPTSESRKSINFQCLLHFCEGICSKANCQWLSETEIDQKQYLGSKLFVARTSDWWTASRDTSLIEFPGTSSGERPSPLTYLRPCFDDVRSSQWRITWWEGLGSCWWRQHPYSSHPRFADWHRAPKKTSCSWTTQRWPPRKWRSCHSNTTG